MPDAAAPSTDQFGPGDVVVVVAEKLLDVSRWCVGELPPCVLTSSPHHARWSWCLGLVGPDEAATWDIKFDFATGTARAFENEWNLISAAMGHPCISLVDFPTEFPFPTEIFHIGDAS